MRVLFASTQGAGHFHPLVRFVDACLRRGHEVLVAGPPTLAPTVDRAGYPFWEFYAPPEDEVRGSASRPIRPGRSGARRT
jgi:UDP:flavonoid glycosyltransferase YjiC (YdhE family)